MSRFPELCGRPVEIRFVSEIRGHGPVHAGAFLRKRYILFERKLRRDSANWPRIFVHELFHFVWLRLSNRARRSYEELLIHQLSLPGELGWSSEWRKRGLAAGDRRRRTRRWRAYCCESFCDTAAWMFTGVQHPEFTLAEPARQARRQWFELAGLTRRIRL